MLNLSRFLSTSLIRKLDLKLYNLSKEISTTFKVSAENVTETIQKHNLNEVVNEAEKLLGNPKPFFNIIFNKFETNSNPIFKKAKNLIREGRLNIHSWDMIVLLISKAAGHNPNISESEISFGILNSQRTLVDIAEMLRTANLVHQKMANLQHLKQFGNELESNSKTILENKIAILVGDYLIGTASHQLAELRNQEIYEIIYSAARNQMESNFIGDRDDENIALPSDPALKINLTDDKPLDDFDNTRDIDMSLIFGHPEREWNFRHTLSSGTLLGKSCQGTLKLAGQSEALQNHGYTFGKHLALAYQASMDLEPFKLQELPLTATFSLVSAPVLFHLDHDSSLYEEIRKGKKSVTNIDFRKIHKIVLDGPGIDETKELQRKHGQIAMDVLSEFPDCDARTALQNIILSL